MRKKLLFLILLTVSILAAPECTGEEADKTAPASSSDAVTAPPAPAAAEGADILWIAGRLPEKSETDDKWLWDEDVMHDETPSHTDGAAKGLHIHSLKTETTVLLDEKSQIVQYAYLDRENPPKGIMISLLLDEDKRVSLYWEGEEEVFADTQDYITAWYMGGLPTDGKWVALDIDIKELDIKKAALKGMEFAAFDGRIFWGETIIKGGRYGEAQAQGQAAVAQ